MWKPKILVLSGGGMKGFYLPGIFILFDVFEYLKSIDTIVGTSIGSLVAALWALGYTGEEMVNLFMNTDFSEMVSEMRASNFVTQGYLGDGEWFETYISKCIKDKTGKDDINLADLFALSKKKLIVNTVLVPIKCKKGVEKKMMIIDHETHPTLSLIASIRMSSCIPGLMKPLLYECDSVSFECYDGGVLDNYMIHFFPPEKVLGIYLGRRATEEEEDVETLLKKNSSILENFPLVDGVKKFIDIIWELFSVVSCDLEKLRMNGKTYKEIRIPTRGIRTLSFTLADSRKYQMILHGMREALKFIVAENRLSC